MKNYKDPDKIYDIMNTTQSNYSNMLKRLQSKKTFSNFVITYYSISLIVYSLTAEFYSDIFDVKLSSYFNIILSVVVLTYSLIITNAKYSERIQAAEKVLNEVKAKKRMLTKDTVKDVSIEYEKIMSKAEYRSEIDFFRTLKQKCKKYRVRWYRWNKGSEWSGIKLEEVERMQEYLGENFPIIQQIKIVFSYVWQGVIIGIPIVIFVFCFWK